MQISKNVFVICAIALLVSAPSLPARETEAQAKAREALQKKMSELDAQEKGMPAPAPTAPTPTAPAVATPAPTSPAAAPAPRVVDDEATARARAALRQKMAELDTQRSSPAKAGPANKQVSSEPSPELKPIAAPPLPISGTKEARLAELLRRYKTDEITPEEYHKQRVKILAEP